MIWNLSWNLSSKSSYLNNVSLRQRLDNIQTAKVTVREPFKNYLHNINILLWYRYRGGICHSYELQRFEEMPCVTHPAGKKTIMFSITYLWTSDEINYYKNATDILFLTVVPIMPILMSPPHQDELSCHKWCMAQWSLLLLINRLHIFPSVENNVVTFYSLVNWIYLHSGWTCTVRANRGSGRKPASRRKHGNNRRNLPSRLGSIIICSTTCHSVESDCHVFLAEHQLHL